MMGMSQNRLANGKSRRGLAKPTKRKEEKTRIFPHGDSLSQVARSELLWTEKIGINYTSISLYIVYNLLYLILHELTV